MVVSQPIISENIESIPQIVVDTLAVSEPIVSENIESITQIVVDTLAVISEPVSEVIPKQVKKQTKKKNVVVSEPIISENIESISQIVVETPVAISEPVSEVIPKQTKKQTKKKNVEPIVSENIESIPQISTEMLVEQNTENTDKEAEAIEQIKKDVLAMGDLSNSIELTTETPVQDVGLAMLDTIISNTLENNDYEDIMVETFTFNDQQYFIDNENNIYHHDTTEYIGVFAQDKSELILF